MRTRRKTILVASLAALYLAATAGCGGDASQPAGGNAGMGAAGSGGAPAAKFSAIYEMIFPMATNARCNACHSLPANDVANGNLFTGTDKASAYKALVGKPSTSSRCMNRPLVVAKQPEMSLLLLKVMPNPPCGVRMPNGGTAFSDAQIEMIRSWIAAGAKDD